MKAWDVMIVGAGPAGSALACRLRPHCRVLLLDRDAASASALPRIGESLPGAARVLLQRIGAFDRFLADAHAERGATVSQWSSHSDDDEPIWFDHLRDPNGPGWHLDRTRFDASLREAAVAAGAELIENCGRLRVSRSADDWQIDLDGQLLEQHGLEPHALEQHPLEQHALEQHALEQHALEQHAQTHRAPVLVDASGRSATVARQLGLARFAEDTLVCLYAYLQTNPDDEDHCTRLCVDRNGWWYSVRVPSGQRVLAFHLDSDDPELKALRDPERLLAKARRQPLLADALSASIYAPAFESIQVHARPAGSAVLDLNAMAEIAPGFFAIGDAVLAFDPIASQGIFHALASAESAARAIEAQLADAPMFREPYLAEMRAVHARYREHLQATYADVLRYRHEPFWAKRAAVMA